MNIAKVIQKQQEVNINYSNKDSKSFDYKTSITGRLEDNSTENEVETVVLLKQLSNFWKALDIPLINSEINLVLTWYDNCVITRKAARNGHPDADPAVAAVNNPTHATFKITGTELYVPVFTLSTEKNNKPL